MYTSTIRSFDLVVYTTEATQPFRADTLKRTSKNDLPIISQSLSFEQNIRQMDGHVADVGLTVESYALQFVNGKKKTEVSIAYRIILPAQTANNYFDPEISIEKKGKIHIYNNASHAYGENFVFPYTAGAISTFNKGSISNSGSNYRVIDLSCRSVLYGTTIAERLAYTYHDLVVDDECTANILTIGKYAHTGYLSPATYCVPVSKAQVSVVQPTIAGGDDIDCRCKYLTPVVTMRNEYLT